MQEEFRYDGDLADIRDRTDQDIYIKKLERHLEKGGDIDVIVQPYYTEGARRGSPGTVLIHSILCNLEKIVKYALDKGAKIWKETILPESHSRKYGCRSWNALEMAIILHDIEPESYRNVFEAIKEKSLESFFTFGLRPLHVACASDLPADFHPDLKDLAIDAECPLWGGMTPVLIAAKFGRSDAVQRLLDLGASAKVRDRKGSTPLHHLFTYGRCDKRLFVYDEESANTSDELTGMSHFHIACYFSPHTFNAVKTYLDSVGVSPDVRIEKHEFYGQFTDDLEGCTGLHLSCEVTGSNLRCCVELAKLLIENGARIDAKNATGQTAFSHFVSQSEYFLKDNADLYELLIDVGAFSKTDRLYEFFFVAPTSEKLLVYRALKRTLALRKNSVSPKVRESLQKIFWRFCEEDPSYDESCKNELIALKASGLKRELDDNSSIEQNFQKKFGALVDSQSVSQDYPLYGQFLRIWLKRRTVQFLRKKRKIAECVPRVTFLAESFCILPVTCAEQILWNFSVNELDQLIGLFC